MAASKLEEKLQTVLSSSFESNAGTQVADQQGEYFADIDMIPELEDFEMADEEPAGKRQKLN